MAEEKPPGPQIVVAFQNYAPSFNTEKAIRRMLRVVPPTFLAGLHAIVLTNVAALSRKERERKTWGRVRHHIHRVHRPKYEADKWSRKLSGKYVRDRYWYLLPVAAPIALVVGLAGDIARLYRKVRR